MLGHPLNRPWKPPDVAVVLRFGELADYVYCTYCAALLLERMDRDRKDAGHQPENSEATVRNRIPSPVIMVN